MKKTINKEKKKMRPFMIFMIGFVFVVLILNTAFSLMSSTLLLSGEASFRPLMDVRITSVSIDGSESGATENYTVNYSKDSIISSVSLPNLNSSVSYKVRVENNGNVNVKLNDISTVNNTNTNCTYSITGIRVNDVIDANSYDEFVVTYKYKSSVSSVPSNTDMESKVQFSFIEDIVIDNEYTKTGLIFDLEGTEAPSNDTWEDLSGNGNNVRLQNITHSTLNNSYSFFGSGSCGFLDKSLIPTSGDFTIDTTFTTGSDSLASADQAIVSQKVIGTKEAGRFKPFNIYNNTIRSWGYLTSSSGIGDSFGTYTTATNGVTYTLTLVRDGNDFKQYANGVLINTYSVQNGQNVSNGTVQVGCFDGANSQNFTGAIHSVRLYDRILTDEQIMNNYEYDSATYYAPTSSFELLDYIRDNLVTSGPGIRYRSELDTYYFQGSAVNNYIMLDDKVFRIISINPDNTLQVFSDDSYGPIAYDASGNRTFGNNSYCNSASSFISGSTTEYYGCNAFSPFANFDNAANSGAVNDDSTLKTYLNTTVYNQFSSSIKNRILTHAFNVGPCSIDGSIDRAAVYQESSAYKWTGKVGTFNVGDVRYAVEDDYQFSSNNSVNYIRNLGNSKSFYWTMNGGKSLNTYDVATLTNKIVSKRRASRTDQSPASFYVKPVIYISSDLTVSGSGSSADPFIIEN